MPTWKHYSQMHLHVRLGYIDSTMVTVPNQLKCYRVRIQGSAGANKGPVVRKWLMTSSKDWQTILNELTAHLTSALLLDPQGSAPLRKGTKKTMSLKCGCSRNTHHLRLLQPVTTTEYRGQSLTGYAGFCKPTPNTLEFILTRQILSQLLLLPQSALTSYNRYTPDQGQPAVMISQWRSLSAHSGIKVG